MTANDLQTDVIPTQEGIPIIVKVLAFMMVLVLVFTAVANLLPQVEGQAPKEVKVDLGSLTMEGYIAMGETLFSEKGTCTLCHNNLGRAPDLLQMDMQTTVDERLNASDYNGDAKDSESYLMESMVEPSKYVVPGYGKSGEPSPMPAIDKAPIELSLVEMGAIIAFLQTKDGGQTTVALPTDVETPKTEQKPPVAEPPKVATSAHEVLTKYGCAACHTVLESASPIGPSLIDIGARLSKEEIRDSIVNPNAVIAQGFPPIMPGNFADKMMVKELDLLVEFLVQSKGTTVTPESKTQSNEDQSTDTQSKETQTKET